MKYGLPKTTIEMIRGVFARFPEIEKAVLYGSRAKGNYQAGSDIDLTLYGDALTPDLRDRIANALDDLLLPYTIDLSLFEELDHAKLREHIERVGVVFYERVSQGVGLGAGWQIKPLGDVCDVIGGGTSFKHKSHGGKKWSNKKLSDLCVIARGGSPRPIQNFLTTSPDGINWIKIGDATGGGKYIYQTAEKIIPAGVSRSRMVHEGDFLLSNSMSFGHPYILKTSGCIHDGWLVLSEYSNYLNQDYLYYLLGSKLVYDQFDKLAAGTTVRNLNKELAGKVVIPVPPLPEQKRIVSILDETFEGIATATANAKKNLANAREVFESTLQSVFSINNSEGWKVKTLGGVCEFHRGLTYAKGDEVESSNNIVLRANNIDVDCNLLNLNDLKYISDSVAVPEKKIVRKNSLLICTASGSKNHLGKVAFIDEDYGYAFGGFMGMLTPRDELLPKYLFHLMSSYQYKEFIASLADGVNINNLKFDDLKLFSVPIPPLSEQKLIIVKLDALSTETKKLESIYQQKLTALDELKKSILKQAFSGQLH